MPKKRRVGWYPDPEQHGSERYWNGFDWKQRRAKKPSFFRTLITAIGILLIAAYFLQFCPYIPQ